MSGSIVAPGFLGAISMNTRSSHSSRNTGLQGGLHRSGSYGRVDPYNRYPGNANHNVNWFDMNLYEKKR